MRESSVVGECWSQLNIASGLREWATDPPPGVNNLAFTVRPEASTVDSGLGLEGVSRSAQQASLDADSLRAQPPSINRDSVNSQNLSSGAESSGVPSSQEPDVQRPIAVVEPRLSDVRLIHMPSGHSTPHRPGWRGHRRGHSLYGLRPFNVGDPPMLCPEYLETASDSDLDL